MDVSRKHNVEYLYRVQNLVKLTNCIRSEIVVTSYELLPLGMRREAVIGRRLGCFWDAGSVLCSVFWSGW